LLERRSFPRKILFPSEATPYVQGSTKQALSLSVGCHSIKSLKLTEEEVDDHRIDSIAASEDPSADNVKVSDWRSDKEEVNNGDDGQKGMLVERNDVGRLTLGRQEGPEGKCNAARKGWGDGVQTGKKTVRGSRHGRLQGDNRVDDRPGGAANVVPV
jgi:hypothetical protein